MQKMIVFDLNCTLVKRIRKSDKETIYALCDAGIVPDASNGMYHMFYRPHLQELADFLHAHDTKYIFWTTAMQKNAQILVQFVEPVLYKHSGYLHQDHCAVGEDRGKTKADKWVKNLDVVKEMYGMDAILVDDSAEKRYKDQQMIQVSEFTGYYDNELLLLIEKLHVEIGCVIQDCKYNTTSIQTKIIDATIAN